ncbi:class I mannose-6-phosphate isomerase [Leucobacter luti]|uniref:Mannose-6-phosphate isomerase n=1 Tax=Leucobacter luti TaxID=340320 RepID=A0A4Q7U0D6_9MICO|nr:class I mannose-6-phosphate isomerase [Leucobacter luti]RZT66834.1 mannose-6-phosphate isomerase [Leucobacter luti]
MTDTGIIELQANQPEARPYRGGSGIARFRGEPQPDAFRPEDFLGSTTEVHAGGGVGLTRLPDGRQLREAIAADPIGFLGTASPSASAGENGLLTKLLSTDERLFVHSHPSDEFAREHGLGCTGKTESWFVLDVAEGSEPYVLLGFSREVAPAELADWFEQQDVAAMVSAMHRIPVAPGDTFHVPAGVPHGIGPGLTLVELQQPTDLSILLEYTGFPGLDRDSALLGMPRDRALSAIRRAAVPHAELAALRENRTALGRVQRLFPAAADPFYAAERVRPGSADAILRAGFAIIVVRAGSGEIRTARGAVAAAPGRVFLARHDAGELRIDPALDLVVCRPAEDAA